MVMWGRKGSSLKITGKQRAARIRNIRIARRSKGQTRRISPTGGRMVKGGFKKERLQYHKGGMFDKGTIRLMTPTKKSTIAKTKKTKAFREKVRNKLYRAASKEASRVWAKANKAGRKPTSKDWRIHNKITNKIDTWKMPKKKYKRYRN